MRYAPLLLTALFAAACGGSDSPALAPAPVEVTPAPSPSAPPPPPPPLAPQGVIDLTQAVATFEVDTAGVGGDSAGDGGVGGAAGDGSPLRRATVVLTDSTGKTLTGQTDDKGAYLLRYKTADYKTPFVVKVLDAGGNVLAAPSEIDIPSGKAARVNINPLTDKITSDVLPASVSGTDKQFSAASLSVAGLAQAKTDLLASVQAALGTAGVANAAQFDPVRSVYRYDGTGVDAVIESISHGRNPATGVTQLAAKLAPVVTAADGSVNPTLISASTPLATTQVAISSNPALTFSKITAWVNFVNSCLTAAPATVNCSGLTALTFVSLNYKQSSKDFAEDFVTLFSETGRQGVLGSEIRNPNILFIGRFPGSTTDDLAVVEVTIRQPRTGPLAGNNPNPIEYTKTLVFKRDDTTTGLKAGNWILHGNQRAYNWSINPNYLTLIQQNPARQADVSGNVPSRTTSGIRMVFDTEVFNTTSRTYVDAGLYAVRLKGPGLPAAGVVYAPTSATTGGFFTILNKTGVIPAEGTTSSRPQADFRMGAVTYPSGAQYNTATWPGNLPHYADSPTTTDFSKLQIFNQYTAEIYIKGNPTPVVETSRVLASIETPINYVQRPLHDLTPSVSLITPPQPSTSSILARWTRNPLGTRIESAFFAYAISTGTTFSSSINVADGFSLSPISTSVTIPIVQGTAPAFVPAGFESREIGITGFAARARFVQSVIWSN
jgi:hypothetical protein